MKSIPTAGTLNVKRLYRYQPLDLGRLRTILEGKLYCSSPRDFNDPWDCHPFFKLPTTTESRENTIQWLMRADRRHSTRSEADYSQREKELKDNPSKVELKVKEISTTIEAGIRKGRDMASLPRASLRPREPSHHSAGTGP